MKKRKNIIMISISIIIVLFFLLKIIPVIILNIAYGKKDFNSGIQSKISFQYTIQDLIKYATNININEEEITIEKQNKLPYVVEGQSYIIDIFLTKINKQDLYYIEWGNDEEKKEEVIENCKRIEIPLKKEGLNKYYIRIKRNGEVIQEYQDNISYIKPYQEQYLDELQKNGVATHFAHGWDSIEYVDLLKDLGVQNVRDDIMITTIFKKDGSENFSTYDKWIPKLKENDINILGILNNNPKSWLFGNDCKISNEKEVKQYTDYVKKILNRFPGIIGVEIINEPNNHYHTDNDIYWYTQTVKSVEQKINNEKIKILSGSTSTSDNNTNGKLLSQDFIRKMFDNGYQYQYISSHFYDQSNTGILNNRFKNLESMHKSLINEYGGFTKLSITEFGDTTYKNGSTEEQQANRIVQQSILTEENNNDYNFMYNFKDYGTNINSIEDNYGIVKKDYTPKPAYYAMKNYYENTNGAEYIGTINLEEGLETHVYDKDGKPKIITWSNNSEKNITIPYENFTAKDIYGNEIKNESGELTITTSPVYLDNIEEKYFYQAISNTATTKYTEFEEKFAEEIEKLPEIKQQTKNLKQQIEQIGKTETRIDEQTAKTLMERHFQLGNSLIHAYQNRRIETEKVKLSSMLDMLNDIGNSYEDLVTVTAKTRNADISQAKDLVKEVENIITSNSDIEIIYPAKILEFSKDYQEKAEYINGLEEENDIKTGLIVSKNLHSIYLSNWAKEFTNIYIDEYLKNNLISESYSEKNITNQDVTVTLNIGDDTKITNNNGSNQYTFTENGEFTFEYERRGRNFRQTVKIENIDKQSPKITGVEEGQVYENKIKPIIEDENLETVKLIQDGRVIDNYINNTEIKEEGIYRIEALDKAGNKTVTSFEIIENISKEYIIENNIIKNIEANTTVEQFKEKIKIQTEYKIQRGEKTLENNEKIATGDILQIGDTQYTLIVRGDIDKDSKITIKDLILLRQQIIGEKTLEDTAKTAGDIELNEKIDARDIVKLRKLILTNNQ